MYYTLGSRLVGVKIIENPSPAQPKNDHYTYEKWRLINKGFVNVFQWQ